MLFLSVLLILVFFVLYVTVVVDMFRQKAWLGFLGLFLFPFTYYHAFVSYSGNRIRMGTALVLTAIIPFAYLKFQSIVGDKELTPFFEKVEENLGMQCILRSGLMASGGTTFYNVECLPSDIESVNYVNQNELLSRYQNAFIEPSIEFYRSTFGRLEDKGIVLIIRSPSDLYACFKIENPGEIIESWSSFEQCE